MLPLAGCLDPTPPVIPGLETSPVFYSHGAPDIGGTNKTQGTGSAPGSVYSGAFPTFGDAQREASHRLAQPSRLLEPAEPRLPDDSAEPPVLDLGSTVSSNAPRNPDSSVSGRSLLGASAGRWNAQSSSFFALSGSSSLSTTSKLSLALGSAYSVTHGR